MLGVERHGQSRIEKRRQQLKRQGSVVGRLLLSNAVRPSRLLSLLNQSRARSPALRPPAMPARIPSSKLPLPVNGPLPHYLMSHLQNVTSKRLATTSIPYTPMNLGIAAILLRQGFISNLTRCVRSRAPGPVSQPVRCPGRRGERISGMRLEGSVAPALSGRHTAVPRLSPPRSRAVTLPASDVVASSPRC